MFRHIQCSSDDASDSYTSYSYNTYGSESYQYACEMVDDPLEVFDFEEGQSKKGVFSRCGDDRSRDSNATKMSVLTVLAALDNAVDSVIDTLIPPTPTRKQLIMQRMKSLAQLKRRREKEQNDTDWWKSFAPGQVNSSSKEKKVPDENTQKKSSVAMKLFTKKTSKSEYERNKQKLADKNDSHAEPVKDIGRFKTLFKSHTEPNTTDLMKENTQDSKRSEKRKRNAKKDCIIDVTKDPKTNKRGFFSRPSKSEKKLIKKIHGKNENVNDSSMF